jgi:hypothetical protein
MSMRGDAWIERQIPATKQLFRTETLGDLSPSILLQASENWKPKELKEPFIMRGLSQSIGRNVYYHVGDKSNRRLELRRFDLIADTVETVLPQIQSPVVYRLADDAVAVFGAEGMVRVSDAGSDIKILLPQATIDSAILSLENHVGTKGEYLDFLVKVSVNGKYVVYPITFSRPAATFLVCQEIETGSSWWFETSHSRWEILSSGDVVTGPSEFDSASKDYKTTWLLYRRSDPNHPRTVHAQTGNPDWDVTADDELIIVAPVGDYLKILRKSLTNDQELLKEDIVKLR